MKESTFKKTLYKTAKVRTDSYLMDIHGQYVGIMDYSPKRDSFLIQDIQKNIYVDVGSEELENFCL